MKLMLTIAQSSTTTQRLHTFNFALALPGCCPFHSTQFLIHVHTQSHSIPIIGQYTWLLPTTLFSIFSCFSGVWLNSQFTLVYFAYKLVFARLATADLTSCPYLQVGALVVADTADKSIADHYKELL